MLGKRRKFRAVHIFHISRRALDARKFDVSENYNHNRTSRINGMCVKIKPREYASQGLMRENLAVRIYVRLQ